MMRRRFSHLRASALLLVLWALLLLSAGVLAWVGSIQDTLVLHGQAGRAGEAVAMAHSGLALALEPAVSRRTPLAPESLAPGQGYEVRLVGEGGKLNLSWLLRGEEPRKLDLLRKWLERRGLDFEQREIFVDSLLDYVDGDSLQRLNGREEQGTYRPANRELRSLDELQHIAGAAPLLAQPGWRDDLTIFSEGPIDLDAAPLEILRLLPGINDTRLQQFVEYRRGPDGLDGTPDDRVFPSIVAIRQLLGLNPEQFRFLEGLVGYQDPTVRAISTGRSGDVTRQASAVFRKGTGRPTILEWREP